MGYMVHHAIVVTSYNKEKLEDAHQQITLASEATQDRLMKGERGCWVSPISPPTTNGYQSFFISPDGSKEGWDESERGDKFRDEVIRILDSFKYEDESTPIDYAEVQFGDEGHDNRVLRASK